MRAFFMFLLVVLPLSVATLYGCGSKSQKYMLSKEESQKERIKQQTEVANPATLNCMNTSGATWQSREDARGGQYGVCLFSDGSWCEEWAYYQKHCTQGTNITSCKGQFWGKTVCEPDYNPVCARVESENATSIIWKKFSNACNACISSTKTDVVVGYVPGECPAG